MTIPASSFRLAVMTLIGTAILIALGLWQWERREWKAAIIAQRQAALKAPPVPIDQIAGETFRRVTIRGYYRHEDTMALPQQVRDGLSGRSILTPLILKDGRAILVERGFLPDHRARELPEPQGEVRFIGVARPLADRPYLWLASNQGWHILDPAAIRELIGPNAVADHYIEALCPQAPQAPAQECSGVLQLRRSPAMPRDPHLQYALTWFSLAAVLLVIAGLLHRRERTKAARDIAPSP